MYVRSYKLLEVSIGTKKIALTSNASESRQHIKGWDFEYVLNYESVKAGLILEKPQAFRALAIVIIRQMINFRAIISEPN